MSVLMRGGQYADPYDGWMLTESFVALGYESSATGRPAREPRRREAGLESEVLSWLAVPSSHVQLLLPVPGPSGCSWVDEKIVGAADHRP